MRMLQENPSPGSVKKASPAMCFQAILHSFSWVKQFCAGLRLLFANYENVWVA